MNNDVFLGYTLKMVISPILAAATRVSMNFLKSRANTDLFR